MRTNRRRSSTGGGSSSLAKDLVGRRLIVPADVFPKERPPPGQAGWKATVKRVSAKPSHVDVIFDSYPITYYFPEKEVRKWLIDDRAPASPLPSIKSASPTKTTPRKSAASKSPTSSMKRKYQHVDATDTDVDNAVDINNTKEKKNATLPETPQSTAKDGATGPVSDGTARDKSDDGDDGINKVVMVGKEVVYALGAVAATYIALQMTGTTT